jgi:hypothetical protein
VSGSSRYLSEVGAELVRAGVPRAYRERIVAEFADHLGCDPDADLGDPAALAAQFADELGTSFARTAACRAFIALTVVGLIVGVRLLAMLPFRAATFGTEATVALLVSALSGQVALVAGGLALLRAIGLRGRAVVAGRETAVLARRAGVGLAAGAVTLLASPISQGAHPYAAAVAVASPGTNVWWPGSSALGLLALLAAVPAVIRAARLRPRGAGQAGDVLVDLGPLQPAAARLCGGSVTRLALILGAGLAIAVALAGAAANDAYDGMLRGLLESGAFLGSYAVLGRYLGIRR